MSKAHQVKKLSFHQQGVRLYIQELSEEIKSTQRAIAGLQKTSVMIMNKLDLILRERKSKKYIEAGYRS